MAVLGCPATPVIDEAAKAEIGAVIEPLPENAQGKSIRGSLLLKTSLFVSHFSLSLPLTCEFGIFDDFHLQNAVSKSKNFLQKRY